VRVAEPLHLSDLTFEGSPTVNGDTIQGEVPLTLNLKPRTSTPFVQFIWEAPDATEVGSTDETLQAIYRREGTYTVTLVGQDSEDHVLRMPITVTVSPAASSLSILMVPETGVAPLTVKFDASDTSIPGETITGFIWNFGDRSEEQFAGAQIEHVFQNEGTYQIDLSVRTTSGKVFNTKKTLVVRAPSLRACILPSRVRGTAPLGVEFSSSCTTGGPTTFLWDFGDDSQSDARNPIHVFQTAGTYTVRMTASDGTVSNTTSVTITAQ
jgi:PKD repeat protein